MNFGNSYSVLKSCGQLSGVEAKTAKRHLDRPSCFENLIKHARVSRCQSPVEFVQIFDVHTEQGSVRCAVVPIPAITIFHTFYGELGITNPVISETYVYDYQRKTLRSIDWMDTLTYRK